MNHLLFIISIFLLLLLYHWCFVLSNASDDRCIMNCMKGWEEMVIKQEQSNDGPLEMKIALPSMPSLYITAFLFQACQEIHKVGGHVLDKSILHNFARSLLEKVQCVL